MTTGEATAETVAETPAFPDRKQDLDHRALEKYMEEHKIRSILAEMIAYLVERRADDHIQGAIDFLEQYSGA
jgi:hypothetical protein